MGVESQTLEDLYTLAAEESREGYLRFLPHVVIDSQPQKLPFRRIAETWQYERAMRSAPALDNLAGLSSSYKGPRSFWNGYHKGSDKTHDDARELCWLLGFSRKRLNCYVCAGSEDQAALITTAMTGIVADNPWIAERVSVTALTAKGQNGSTLTVLPMNAWTGQGIFPDYVIASEVTHWQYEDGKRFWEFILESVNKRPHCVLKVETNAGMRGTWQWEERNRVSKSRFWSFYEAPVGKPLPSWMNQEKIDDDSQGLSPGERDRLYKNRWVDPGEEHGYLTEKDALLCRDLNLTERTYGDYDNQYYLVIDYGGVNDRCALAVMHAEVQLSEVQGLQGPELIPRPCGVVVDRLDCWQGTHDNRVGIVSTAAGGRETRNVQDWIEVVRKNFSLTAMIVDPNQLEGLAIYYESVGLRVIRFEYRGGKANYRMAQILKTSVENRLVKWSPYAGRLPESYLESGRLRRVEDVTLEQELAMLVTKPTMWGYRFDHESGRHDDRAVVVGMGLLHAFPEGAPLGLTGPVALADPRKETSVLGSRPKIKDEHGHTIPDDPCSLDNSPARWKLFGLSGGGKWEQGDID